MSDQQIVLSGGEDAIPVVAWDPNSGAQLPAYLAEVQDELGTNIPDRQTVPSLSYEGKMWSIVKDGNKTKLQVPNADGDIVPVPIMRAVILNFNADRGRAYYPGTYNPAASAAPTCWSADGKAPDASVREKQSALCAACPQSVKGSKIMEGREMVACSSHRMIAIAPSFDLTSDPLRLKIAVTSDYDKEIVEHGWFAFRQYVDYLKSRGVTNTALVVTKMKFDPNPAYPKILFALDRVLTQSEVAQVKQALANPKIAELLNEKWSAAGSAGTPTDDSDIAPQPNLQQTIPEVRPAPQSPAHYHGRGTDAELWWDEATTAWVKPWAVSAPEPAPAPPPPPPPAPVTALDAPPQVPKPTDPAHLHAVGTADEKWWNGAEWVEPWVPEVAAAPAPTPPPPPAPVVPPHDAHAAALADGWVQHPDSAPHGYKGTDVLAWADIEAKYPAPGNGAAGGGTAAAGNTGATSGQASPAGAGSGQSATNGASPTDPNTVPADVQALLNDWTGG
jgi:hypothetical protein